MDSKTFTITFGDMGENHKGMEIIGKDSGEGFKLKDLKKAKKWFNRRGVKTELIKLAKFLPDGVKAQKAYVLVARKGLNAILKKHTAEEFFEEQDSLPKDTKAFMYGKVVDKKARHNLCFAEEGSEADYENKKGTVVAFDQVPILAKLRKRLRNVIGKKGDDMIAEGNYYYDPSVCGIGFHGDAERWKVVGVRVGASLPLHFQWFVQGEPIGERCKLLLNHGDVYFMEEKATGRDWKKKIIPTLRHAAGSRKFLTILPKKTKEE